MIANARQQGQDANTLLTELIDLKVPFPTLPFSLHVWYHTSYYLLMTIIGCASFIVFIVDDAMVLERS